MTSYPRRITKTGIVINELCTCGKLRTEHEDNHPVFAQGHGPCKASRCKRFTWAKNVFEDSSKH